MELLSSLLKKNILANIASYTLTVGALFFARPLISGVGKLGRRVLWPRCAGRARARGRRGRARRARTEEAGEAHGAAGAADL